MFAKMPSKERTLKPRIAKASPPGIAVGRVAESEPTYRELALVPSEIGQA